MDINGAFFQVDIGSPDPVKQLAAAVDTPGVTHKKLEQPVIGWSQVDLDAIDDLIKLEQSDDYPLQTCLVDGTPLK